MVRAEYTYRMSNEAGCAEKRTLPGLDGRVFLRESLGRNGCLLNGGDRRSAQLGEIITRDGAVIRDLCLADAPSGILRHYIMGWRLGRELGLLKYGFRTLLRRWGRLRDRYEAAFRSQGPADAFLWERTRFPVGAFMARRLGMPVIALPHNVESLVPESRDKLTGVALPDSIGLEKKYLEMANAVFCISREEQWLLSNLGITVEFLPYYPPSTEAERFLRVRARRPSEEKDCFLVIGSAANYPTGEGMRELLLQLAHFGPAINQRFEVIGRGVEVLAGVCQKPWLRLHGEVDDATLDQMLARSKAVLVHQRRGAGALTRIVEMLLAGVPVIGNQIACRTHFGVDGVHCYESWQELSGLLQDSLGTPNKPVQPRRAAARLVEVLRRTTAKAVARAERAECIA